jgi:TPR repeat protein
VRLRDSAKARAWLQKAAELGNPEAAQLILEGANLRPSQDSVDDVFQWAEPQCRMNDQAEAVWSYQLAAERGHKEAAKRLAEMGEAGTKAIIDLLRSDD